MTDIRNTTAEDIKAILELEKECFDSEAWSRRDFEYAMENEGHILLSAFEDGVFAGYVAASDFAGEMNIDSVAVCPDIRRRGLGKKLVSAALEKKSVDVYLEVRVSNLPAISLYKSLGFKEVYIRKNYYSHPEEDALIMKREDTK